MTNKEQKLVAKEILKKIDKDETKPNKMKAEYVGVQYNEKGHFYSALFTIDLVIKSDKGEVNFLRDIQIPLNLGADVSVKEEVPPKPKKEAKEKKVEKKPEVKSEPKPTNNLRF